MCTVILEFRMALYYRFPHTSCIGHETRAVQKTPVFFSVSLLKTRHFTGDSLIILMNFFQNSDRVSDNLASP